MSYPNVVLAGAPKCGTTSVFEFLADHPDVCPSSVKETYFLIDEDYALYKPGCNVATQGLEGYSQFFTDCEGSAAKVYLEATPDYLYQDTPLKYLPELDPVPHVVFILRKPAERVYSMFQFARNNMAVIDAHMTFADFLDNVRNPASGVLKDRPLLRGAMAQSRYVRFIERWLQVLGRDRIHVFLFEDLVRDPRDFMKTLCEVLDLNPAFYEDYGSEKRNVTRKVRVQFLHRLKRHLRKLGSGVPGRRLASELYRHLNAAPASNTRSNEDTRLIEALGSEFIDDNRRLTQLLGIDLTCWQETRHGLQAQPGMNSKG